MKFGSHRHRAWPASLRLKLSHAMSVFQLEGRQAGQGGQAAFMKILARRALPGHALRGGMAKIASQQPEGRREARIRFSLTALGRSNPAHALI